MNDDCFAIWSKQVPKKVAEKAAAELARLPPKKRQQLLKALGVGSNSRRVALASPDSASGASHTPTLHRGDGASGRAPRAATPELVYGSGTPQGGAKRLPDPVPGRLRLADGTLVAPPQPLRPIRRPRLAAVVKTPASGAKGKAQSRSSPEFEFFLCVLLEEVERARPVKEQIHQWRSLGCPRPPPVVVRECEVEVEALNARMSRVDYVRNGRTCGSVELEAKHIVHFQKFSRGGILEAVRVPSSRTSDERRSARDRIEADLRHRHPQSSIVWITGPIVVAAVAKSTRWKKAPWVQCETKTAAWRKRAVEAIVARTAQGQRRSSKRPPSDVKTSLKRSRRSRDRALDAADRVAETVAAGTTPAFVSLHDLCVAAVAPTSGAGAPSSEPMIEMWLSYEQLETWMEVRASDILRRASARAKLTPSWVGESAVAWALSHVAAGRGGGRTRRLSVPSLKAVLRYPKKTAQAVRRWAAATGGYGGRKFRFHP